MDVNLKSRHSRRWAARLAVAIVLAANLSAAVPYVIAPERYAPAFELSGAAGAAMVRGIGVLFLMWCVAYVPVILRPDRRPALFGVILAQQIVGLTGEAWIAAGLPAGHAALAATGLRFMVFDGAGLALLLLAFALARPRPE
jgi:hypothetical protein